MPTKKKPERRTDVATRTSRKPATSGAGAPLALAANSGLWFVGARLQGLGFLLTSEERESLVRANPDNARRIFPFVSGADISGSPTQTGERYAINFGGMSQKEASRWPELMSILRERVRPERERWWQYAKPGPYSGDQAPSLTRRLVAPLVARHLFFCFQPIDRVLSEQVFIFSVESFTFFAVLQSRTHGVWTGRLCSRMASDLRYSGPVCFDTFPFPRSDPRATISELETIGKKLYGARTKHMVDTDQGLTKTYTAIKDTSRTDPRIVELRRLHEQMDRAVLDAYGWKDVAVPPYCPKSDADREAVEAFEDEVFDRLYVLNAERAREEQLAGQATDGKKGAAAKKPRGKKKGPEGQRRCSDSFCDGIGRSTRDERTGNFGR